MFGTTETGRKQAVGSIVVVIVVVLRIGLHQGENKRIPECAVYLEEVVVAFHFFLLSLAFVPLVVSILF